MFNLKIERQRKKMTQKELADKIGCGIMTISDYERGVYFPPAQTLCKLADILDVSVDYLLGRKGRG